MGCGWKAKLALYFSRFSPSLFPLSSIFPSLFSLSLFSPSVSLPHSLLSLPPFLPSLPSLPPSLLTLPLSLSLPLSSSSLPSSLLTPSLLLSLSLPPLSPSQLPSSQSQILHQNPMRPQNKYPRQRPTNVPSFQFQPLPQRGIPVFYPQQAAIMTDPNWYYNNMMLYQVIVKLTETDYIYFVSFCISRVRDSFAVLKPCLCTF